VDGSPLPLAGGRKAERCQLTQFAFRAAGYQTNILDALVLARGLKNEFSSQYPILCKLTRNTGSSNNVACFYASVDM
jgi:hypothetical protein